MPMDVAAFTAGLKAGKHESLNVLNPEWIFFSGHQAPYDDLVTKAGYRIVHDGSDADFAKAQRGAARIVLFGDVVHVVGGRPVFFGLRYYSERGPISLEIGSVPPVSGLRVAGPPASECDYAIDDGLVFDPGSVNSDLALLRSQGASVSLVDKIELLAGDLEDGNEGLRVSADAVVRRLLEEPDIAPHYRDFLTDESLDSSELLPIETCREILICVLEQTWREDRELTAALSWAAIVEQRLRLVARPPLAGDDDDALGSLGP